MSDPTKEADEITRLRLLDEYVELKMNMMVEDDGGGTHGSEMAWYAKQALTTESENLTIEDLEELIREIGEFNGDEEDEGDENEDE